MKENLLPYDGRAIYCPGVLDSGSCQKNFGKLLENIHWQQDEGILFGKHYVTKRKVAWYGDEDFDYSYSNKARPALPWTSDLIAIKEMVESICGSSFNSCLLNLYHNGNEGMGWHSDNEKTMSPGAPIASLSLGVARMFKFRHKESQELIEVLLEPGSLLIMEGETQLRWKHCLPKSSKIAGGRINLTFRKYVRSEP